MVQFLEGRNRAWAQLDAPINGSDTNVALVAWQGSRLSDVTTASGRKVRSQIYERDAETGAITKCELVDITNNVSDVLIIERVVESTRATDTTNTYAATPQSFTANAIIEEVISSEVLSEIQDEVNRIVDEELPLKADQADVDALTNIYAAASGGTDNYAFTIPGFTGYAANVGKTYKFLADVANTWASWVNISGYGNIPMYKWYDNDTVTGDIKANQIITIVIWLGGTSVQMTSQVDTIVDLSSYATRSKTYTISGGVIAWDVVYPSAADTVKKLYPSAMTNTGISVSTAPTNASTTRNMKLSTSWRYLHIAWWSQWVSATLNAQVRTINAWETDFSNGTAVAIYSTWNGTRSFSVCEISTDKFLIIFQADTGWSWAGIKCVVISVSGTVVTVWSISTIESTGWLASWQGCAKVDTDKGIIFYWRDSDQDLMTQVLTVSGTTITTNTPVLVKACSNTQLQSPAVQLSTNTIAVVYQDWGTSHIFGRVITVSWTTPTIWSENTIITSPWTSSVGFSLAFISATKIFFHYSNNSPVNDTCINIAISGATMTPSSTLALGSDRTSTHAWIMAIWTDYLLFYHKTASTTLTIRFLNVSGTTPTEISSSWVSVWTISQNLWYSIAKVSPWTYIVCGSWADTDFIVKLTPISSARVWVAESTIADGATGAIAKRFNNATLSSLIAWSKYYADDDWQVTANSSLTAPEVWYADSPTNLILT